MISWLVLSAAVLAGLATIAFRWLTPGGALAAVTVGLALFWGSGPPALGLLLLFFVSSSAWTTAGRRGRSGRVAAADESDARGRTARQVLANAGVAAVAAVAGRVGWLPGTEAAIVGALAAATADTWATEIGVWAARRTRLVTSWRPVAPGVSGGVSAPGTLGGVAGAGLVGIAAALFLDGGVVGWTALAVMSGAAGAGADSVAGATLERRGGIWNNDTVNLLGTAVGGLAGWLIGLGPY